MPSPPSRLERFRDAQASPYAGFDSALEEIRNGSKQGHWIWYVFPQIAGLGMSPLSREFAIENEAEATAFLRDPELRSRFLRISRAVHAKLKAGLALADLMGSSLDARKVVSSLTLFGRVAQTLSNSDGLPEFGALADVAKDVLDIAAAEGYPPCAHTLRRLDAGT